MAENQGKWPSKRGPISKIRPSDGCGRDAVPLAVERWYDFHGFGCHLGNVGEKAYLFSVVPGYPDVVFGASAAHGPRAESVCVFRFRL